MPRRSKVNEMATKKTFEVKFRRRRKKKTNYRKRLALLKSGLPRLVVRRSLNNVVAQLVDYKPEGDYVVVGLSSQNLKKFGWNYHKGNIPSAYLAGLLLGRLAQKKGVKKALLDIGLQTPVHGSIPFAALKGFIDAGIEVSHDKKVLPSDDRLSGKHISDYAGKLSEEDLRKRFASYLGRGLDPRKIKESFDEVKKKIMVA